MLDCAAQRRRPLSVHRFHVSGRPARAATQRMDHGRMPRRRGEMQCRPARPFPSSIFPDKNRRDTGKSQSIRTDSEMETAASRSPRVVQRIQPPQTPRALHECLHHGGVPVPHDQSGALLSAEQVHGTRGGRWRQLKASVEGVS
eukprot:COSAG01_NODE_6129_length_3835_cov_2.876907_2_plen_144_part_00